MLHVPQTNASNTFLKNFLKILLEYQIMIFYQKVMSNYQFFFLILSINMSLFINIFFFTDVDLHDISGYTVGTQYLHNLHISSAEMMQYLCNIKMSNTNAITKKYRVPFFNFVLRDKIVTKYMNRPARCKNLTLTEYLK